MLRIRIVAIAASAFVNVAAQAFSAPLMIDTFDTGGLTFAGPGASITGETTGTMLGGERDEAVTNASSSGGIIAGVSDSAFSYGAVSAGGLATLIWDGTDSSAALDPLGLGGIDLSAGGSRDALMIEILSNDFVAELTLVVYSSGTDFATAVVMTPGGLPAGPPEILVVPFAAFVPSGAGADFSVVGALALTIDGLSEPQLDLTIGSFSAVTTPEPTPLLLVGLGLGYMTWKRRRSRRMALATHVDPRWTEAR